MSTTVDMTSVIVPKSDQLNSDDLIAGPRTITIRDVRVTGGKEQPVSIYFDGDDNKPYKPCKSMCRVLVQCWGSDAKEYVGRSMTLYRDPSVKWAGMEVGGIRISHLSDIPNEITMALTASKAQRKPFTVTPLKNAPKAAKNVDPTARRDKMLKFFDENKVSVDRYLGAVNKHSVEDLTDSDIDELAKKAKAIKDGMPVDEAFPIIDDSVLDEVDEERAAIAGEA